MKTACDFYYKCNTTAGIIYYGIKLHSEEQNDIDSILDSLNKKNISFIEKEEFDKEAKGVRDIKITKDDDENKLVCTLFYGNENFMKERRKIFAGVLLTSVFSIITFYWGIGYLLKDEISHGLFLFICGGIGLFINTMTLKSILKAGI